MLSSSLTHALLLHLFILLLSLSLSSAANSTVPYGTLTTILFPAPSATIVSFTDPGGTTLDAFNTTDCLAIASFPVVTQGVCFTFTGNSTVFNEPVITTVSFPVLSHGFTLLYSIDVLNYLTAFGGALGPVPQDTSTLVFFHMENTFDSTTYVVLLNLPTNGEFVLDGTPLNTTDLGKPFLTFHGRPNFFYTPSFALLTNNASVDFYASNALNTVRSNIATLVVIAEAAQETGFITFYGNNTCMGFGSVCTTNFDDVDVFANVTYPNADQFRVNRPVTLYIFLANPTAAQFSIPDGVVVNYLLQRDLQGNFDPEINHNGGFQFSSDLTLIAPLDMIQASVNPININGNNDGLGFNIGFQTMPPMQFLLALITCIIRRNTELDTCSQDPQFGGQGYLNGFVSTEPTSVVKIPFTWFIWLILLCLTCMACFPTYQSLISHIEWCTKVAPPDCNKKCIPWCQTWPPCYICYCCRQSCGYHPELRKAKKERQPYIKESIQRAMRAKQVAQCGCCFCCCGQYLEPREVSDMGSLCSCCDYMAKRAYFKMKNDEYNKQFAERLRKEGGGGGDVGAGEEKTEEGAAEEDDGGGGGTVIAPSEAEGEVGDVDAHTSVEVRG